MQIKSRQNDPDACIGHVCVCVCMCLSELDHKVIYLLLTQVTKQLHSQSSEDEEKQHEEKTQIPHLYRDIIHV